MLYEVITEVYEKWIEIGGFKPENGTRLMYKIIKKGELPEVVLTASDSIAVGALSSLYKAEIRVPDDISIFGFNDIPAAKYTSVITSYSIHYTKLYE